MIACQNFQLNHAIYHNSIFHPMFLLAILVTFYINLPLILVVNIFLDAISKNLKKRFERYLNQLDEE